MRADSADEKNFEMRVGADSRGYKNADAADKKGADKIFHLNARNW